MYNSTINENMMLMEPSDLQRRCIINQCLDGLCLYAAQLEQKNRLLSTDKLRMMIKIISDFWGFNEDDSPPSTEERLNSFDGKIYDARQGNEVNGGDYRIYTDTIYGLHCHGEEIARATGRESISEILDICDLIENVAKHWDFQPYDRVTRLIESLRSKVLEMLDDYVLPGQAANGENCRFSITQGIMFDDNIGFVLAHGSESTAPYVTWVFYVSDNKCVYEMGHYFNIRERATIDYINRATEHLVKKKVVEIPLPHGLLLPQ